MRIGLDIVRFNWPGSPGTLRSTLGRIGRTAEQVGLDSLWVMDHLFQIRGFGRVEDEMLEAYGALAYLAGVTDRLQLGCLVTAVNHRHPGMLIKQVTTLDVLSGGRAYFGIGAGWNEEEQLGLGVPTYPLAERFERLEEALRIAHQMWAGDDRRFEGSHYRLDRPLNSPNSVRRPRPPILIGGAGERKTLRLVARYADACNLMVGEDDQQLRHKLDVLAKHCDEIGRTFAEIEKTIFAGQPEGPAPRLIERYGRLAELGFDHVIVDVPELWREDALALLADIVPEVHAITPAGR